MGTLILITFLFAGWLTWNQINKKKNVAFAIVVVAVFVLMALTNPSKEKLEEASGNHNFEVADCIFFSFCYPYHSQDMAFGIFGLVIRT